MAFICLSAEMFAWQQWLMCMHWDFFKNLLFFNKLGIKKKIKHQHQKVYLGSLSCLIRRQLDLFWFVKMVSLSSFSSKTTDVPFNLATEDADTLTNAAWNSFSNFVGSDVFWRHIVTCIIETHTEDNRHQGGNETKVRVWNEQQVLCLRCICFNKKGNK